MLLPSRSCLQLRSAEIHRCEGKTEQARLQYVALCGISTVARGVFFSECRWWDAPGALEASGKEMGPAEFVLQERCGVLSFSVFQGPCGGDGAGGGKAIWVQDGGMLFDRKFGERGCRSIGAAGLRCMCLYPGGSRAGKDSEHGGVRRADCAYQRKLRPREPAVRADCGPLQVGAG